MVPLGTKLQNELLLELARNLRQERLLIGSERQNLQSLNQKVRAFNTITLFSYTGVIHHHASHTVIQIVVCSIFILPLVLFQIH